MVGLTDSGLFVVVLVVEIIGIQLVHVPVELRLVFVQLESVLVQTVLDGI